MGSTFLSLHYHLVFSTKDRRPFIREDWLPDLHGYLGGAVRGLGGLALEKSSSVWAASHNEPVFRWQDGYGAFAVSHSHCSPISAYIRSQPEHHQKIGFVEELRRLLERNGVVYNEEYLV